ncbi:MAG: GNAT family N-acetyltransferase [Bacteroidales bacterium]
MKKQKELLLVCSHLKKEPNDYSSIVLVKMKDTEKRLLTTELFSFHEFLEFVNNIIDEQTKKGFTNSKHFTEEDLIHTLEIYEFYVIHDNGAIISTTCFATKEKDAYAVLFYVFTKEDYRRRGCASLLLDFMAQRVLETEKKFLFLFVNVKNKDAINFYKNKGYIEYNSN